MSEMPKVKRDHIDDKFSLSDLNSQLCKSDFFKAIKKEKIDLDVVVEKEKSSNEDFHKFNFLIKSLCGEGKITMIECATFLYEDYFKMNEVLSCLNEDNTYRLRSELSKKYKIKMDRNILQYFLY